MAEHIAFYLSSDEDKSALIHQITQGFFSEEISSAQGAVFSEITLKKFIQEENLHDRFNIIPSTKNSFQHYSEGEKKKLLLDYIIRQNPDYIIVDQIFDHLDSQAQKFILEKITLLSQTKQIIQITSRQKDLLPFIRHFYIRNEKEWVRTNALPDIKNTNYFSGSIPPPLQQNHLEINPLVQFRNVTIRYGERTIVHNINWSIERHEFWHLTGPNGSGKSTLLSLINGQNSKAYGQDLTLFGRKKGSGETLWDIRKHIGYFASDMIRQHALSQSVERMILSGFHDSIGLYTAPTSLQKTLTEQWLTLLKMSAIQKQSFRLLSAGHQRLVLLARAMVKHPSLLILDEPTADLDDHDVLLFSEMLQKMSQETSTSILFVSHRKETGIHPRKIFELKPTEFGSIGIEHTVS